MEEMGREEMAELVERERVRHTSDLSLIIWSVLCCVVLCCVVLCLICDMMVVGDLVNL